MLKIDDLTIGEARQIASLLGGSRVEDGPWEIGKVYMIRTVRACA